MVTKFLGVTSLGLVARYRGAVDVKGAADLYGQGRSLRQIGAELGLSATTVNEQRRRAGVTLGRAVLRLIPHPHSRSWGCVTKARPGIRWRRRAGRGAV